MQDLSHNNVQQKHTQSNKWLRRIFTTGFVFFIEVFYNRQRLHQTLNYHTPEQFEQLYDVA